MNKPTPPATPLAVANRANAAARRMRAEWLQSITAGLITPDDVIEHASTSHGASLRRIRLRQLLLAVDRSGYATVERQLSVLENLIGELPTNANIGWLLDNRVLGKRLMVWIDFATPRVPIAPGFPYAPIRQHTATGKRGQI